LSTKQESQETAKSSDTKGDAGNKSEKSDGKSAEVSADAKPESSDKGAGSAESVEATTAPEAAEEAAPKVAELVPPRALPLQKADADAPPPGLAPPGDSRSYRRRTESGEEFFLLYRHYRTVVTRRGPVGKYGKVTVSDFPSQATAAHAYANLCSECAAEGFYDLRE